MVALIESEDNTILDVVTTGVELCGGGGTGTPILMWRLPTGYRIAGRTNIPGSLAPIGVPIWLQAHLPDGTAVAAANQASYDAVWDGEIGLSKMYDITVNLDLDKIATDYGLADPFELYFTVDILGDVYHCTNPYQTSAELFYTEFETTLALTLASSEIFAGQNISGSVELRYYTGVGWGNVPGTQQILIEISDGRTFTTNCINGVSSFNIPFPAAGNYTITASFAGGEI